jgi:proteasome lid subunit RPN8/RPN11
LAVSKEDERPQQESGRAAEPASDRSAAAGEAGMQGPKAAPEPAEPVQAVWRRFPGPAGTDVPLRVATDRAPYAELVAHAKQSLDAEVCGVLVGDVCEDEVGLFVHIRATIAGTAANAGSTHVTFTQETWTAIHEEMDSKYPQQSIVGWYHSHPGLGVVFSEMDVFIQKHFFPGPTQIALVTDPLGGSEALCVNGPRGVEYIDRFWVEGRERRTTVPGRGATTEATAAPESGSAPALERLETRITQALQAIEEQRRILHQVVVGTALTVAMAVIGYIGYTVYTRVWGVPEPPRIESYIPVPIRVGDATVLMGVGVVSWSVPPSLDAAYVKLEERRRKEREAADSAARATPPAPQGRSTPPSEPTKKDGTR